MSTPREDLLSPPKATPASATPPEASMAPPASREPPASGWLRTQAARAYRWLAANSFAPNWLPRPWRRIWIGYIVAALAQLLAVPLTTWLDHTFPEFGFPSLLATLAIVLVALTFGAGPSLLATVAGAILLDYFIIMPNASPRFPRAGDAIGMALLLLVGITISLCASMNEGQRLKAQELAREREAMLEAVPDGFVIYDEHRNIVRINTMARRLLGIERRGGFSAQSSAKHGARQAAHDLHGAPIPPEQSPLSRVLRGETLSGAASMDIVIETFDGRKTAVNVSGAPVRGAENQLVGAAIVMRDLTAQRRLEEAVRTSERQLRATFEQAAVGIALVDLDGRLLRANHRFAAILGYRLDELVGRGVQDLSHPTDLAAERGLLQRMLAGESASAALEKRYLNKHGAIVRTNLTLTLVRDDDGAPLYFAAIVEDITARRALERRTHEALAALLAMAEVLVSSEPEALSATEAFAAGPVAKRLAELTASVLGCRRVGITAIDPETDVMRAIAVAGVSPEQGREWWAEQSEGTRLADSPDQAMVARLRAGEVVTFDMSQPPYSAQPNPLGIRDILLAPMRMGERLVGLLALDDGGAPHTYTADERALARAVARLVGLVVERERLFMQREEARARALALDAANQRMNDFLGVASHELKTPVTSLKVNIQLATRWLDKLIRTAGDFAPRLAREVEPIREVLQRSDRTMARLTRLVDDLLDISRIRAGKLELRRERCDLLAIVRDVVQEQRAVVAESATGRTITLELPHAPTIAIEADADRIGQALTNYLTNALKYSPPTEPVEARVEILEARGSGVETAGRVARMSVRDHGPGLPPEELHQIWEPFHRAEGIAVQSGSGVGLGLGLFISREIVERHGGQVGVESAPGRGATFWFTLPLA